MWGARQAHMLPLPVGRPSHPGQTLSGKHCQLLDGGWGTSGDVIV